MAHRSPHPSRFVLLEGASTPIDRAQIAEGATVRDVLVSLDASGCQVVVVVDADRRATGLLTDGDVRRALLRGVTLSDPVVGIMRKDFTHVKPRAPRADVLDMMQSQRIAEVPVLDEGRRLVGVHLLHDVIDQEERPNHAMVMAGGRGTRLGPITDTLPKPMVRVAGRPILERIVLQLVGAGIRHVFLSVHYLAEVIEEHFGDGSRFGCHIDYVREDVPLGTAGALALLPAIPHRPLLVMNGDLVTQADLGAMLDFHVAQGLDATIATQRYLHTVPFGCVDLDGHRVTGLDEKPTLQKTVNAGIYVLDPDIVASVGTPKSMTMPELISTAIAARRHVGAWEILDDWHDVGRVEQLERARGG